MTRTPSTSHSSLVARIKSEAERLGFIACGISDLSATEHAEQLDRWLESGMAGNMRYLHRQARRRKDPSQIAPGARSVVVVLDNYYSTTNDRGPVPKVARYAVGEDYHRATMDRLSRMADFLRESGAEMARCYADAGPVPERELAQRAGLGWIGKNTMLIRPDSGSWFFIGSVITDLELPPDQAFTSDHCGTCRRCLDACPTEAFPEPRVLDATRCISYLTIEHRGDIPESLAKDFDGWAFGCDICNEVCPWNVKFASSTEHVEFLPRAIWRDAGRPDYFDRMSAEEFQRSFADTPLERPGLAGMRRNWKVAFESRPD